MNWRLILRKNYQQLFVVLLIFLFMIAGSFLSTSIVMRRQLVKSGSELMNAAEANLWTNLQEPEATLISSAFSIRDMIVNQDRSQADILRYLTTLSDWLMNNSERLSGFNGMYGFIRGDYLDGAGWEPPAGYVPQERPWYTLARSTRGKIARTAPYIDADTQAIVVSFSQEMFTDNGSSLGVVAMDVELSRLESYVRSIKLGEEGYGILVDPGMNIIVHPDEKYSG
jgi:hypothetical protein